MKNKILKIIIATIVLSKSSLSFADGLSDAFADITTATVPSGVYKSKTRTSVVGGAFSARFDQTTFSLFSYSPPRLSAGCGGIDAHLGGFSFINGIDFQQLTENIAQNALGLVLHLAIEVGCPVCAEKIGMIEDWAKDAAALSIDSCKAAQSIIAGLNSNGTLCEVLAPRDSSILAASDDSLSARDKCNNEVNSYDTYQEQFGFVEDSSGSGQTVDPAQKNKAKFQCVEGQVDNTAWCIVTNTKLIPGKDDGDAGATPLHIGEITNEDLKRKFGWGELFYLMMLEPVQKNDPVEEESSTGEDNTKQADTVTFVNDIYNFAVCGTQEPSNDLKEILSPYCQLTWDKATSTTHAYLIDVCKFDGDIEDYKQCKTTEKIHISTWADTRNFFEEGGLYGEIATVLFSAANKVQTKTALDTAEKNVIAAAPFPLYQLFNLSSVYPSIYDQFLGSASVALADMLAHQYFREKLGEVTRNVEVKDIDHKALSRLRKHIEKFSVPLRKEALAKFASSASANERAFQNDMLNQIEMYQRLLVRDIADAQMGANISASKYDVFGAIAAGDNGE